ncbi:hypothetical protein B7P43_G09854, partial [Cryptotermes secundus]
ERAQSAVITGNVIVAAYICVRMCVYRVSQEERSVFCEVMVSVILRSPDLTPCLKAKVYTHHPPTFDELKAAITKEINAIPRNMTRRVMKNFQNRLRKCVENGGGHFGRYYF